jgi:type II secretion system protein H
MTYRRLSLFSTPTGRRASTRARRAGYTLLEVSVVVAIMAVIAAIAIPSMLALMGDADVASSGDQIRARLADARSMAMETGKPVRFGFVPGTGKFQFAPDDSDAWNTVPNVKRAEQDDLRIGELADEVLFSMEMNSFNGSGPSSSGSWTSVFVFLPEGGGRTPFNPDGTSNDDVTFYYGRAGYSPMAVEIRGLTGAVRVFDPAPEGGVP